jgi:titin
MVNWLSLRSNPFSSRRNAKPQPRRYRPSVEPLERRELLSVFAVTSNADSGPGTLRQAILDANAHPGSDTITFDLTGSTSILPTTPLPISTDTMAIDGTTQPGYAGHPLIVLDGGNAGTNHGAGVPGLDLGGGSGSIRGLVIDDWSGPGILVGTPNAVITGTYLGIDASGTVAAGNADGIEIGSSSGHVTIGGTAAGAGNLISGNRVAGVLLEAAGNLLQGNYIGANAAGTNALANNSGIACESVSNTIGGVQAGAGNLISGNFNAGVVLSEGDNLLQGNYIGTNAAGTAALGNYDGIDCYSVGNTIGETQAGARNLISGNKAYGVAVESGNLVQGNYIGTNVSGTAALGNDGGVIVYDRYVTVAGNLISGNTSFGIELTDRIYGGNLVVDNHIGTDATGTAALGNEDGVIVDGPHNIIGAAGAGNLISGNRKYGLVLSGFNASQNEVRDNYIGTDATGTATLGNYDGVIVTNAPDNSIGGFNTGNVISGNRQNGVVLFGAEASTNAVQDNFIGTNRTGDAALPNRVGVVVDGAPDNTVGFTDTADRNLISGNTSYGIVIANPGATGNTVTGNWIGVNAAGTAALSNGVGIQITASSNTIGGTALGAGNLISGNFWYGVQISGAAATGNLVEANVIGLSANHANALSNKVGVYLQNAANNTIGGTTTGAGNIIAENGWGVRIQAGSNNVILGNSIFGNTVLGIQLLSGGNNNQAAPVLGSAINSPGATTVYGTLMGAANTTYTLEFFATQAHYAAGTDVQGETFLGRARVTTLAQGVVSFSATLSLMVPAGEFVTATVTDPNGNTSQFSNGLQVQ